jgi:hypothetical protein
MGGSSSCLSGEPKVRNLEVVSALEGESLERAMSRAIGQGLVTGGGVILVNPQMAVVMVDLNLLAKGKVFEGQSEYGNVTVIGKPRPVSYGGTNWSQEIAMIGAAVTFSVNDKSINTFSMYRVGGIVVPKGFGNFPKTADQKEYVIHLTAPMSA